MNCFILFTILILLLFVNLISSDASKQNKEERTPTEFFEPRIRIDLKEYDYFEIWLGVPKEKKIMKLDLTLNHIYLFDVPIDTSLSYTFRSLSEIEKAHYEPKNTENGDGFYEETQSIYGVGTELFSITFDSNPLRLEVLYGYPLPHHYRSSNEYETCCSNVSVSLNSNYDDTLLGHSTSYDLLDQPSPLGIANSFHDGVFGLGKDSPVWRYWYQATLSKNALTLGEFYALDSLSNKKEKESRSFEIGQAIPMKLVLPNYRHEKNETRFFVEKNVEVRLSPNCPCTTISKDSLQTLSKYCKNALSGRERNYLLTPRGTGDDNDKNDNKDGFEFHHGIKVSYEDVSRCSKCCTSTKTEHAIVLGKYSMRNIVLSVDLQKEVWRIEPLYNNVGSHEISGDLLRKEFRTSSNNDGDDYYMEKEEEELTLFEFGGESLSPLSSITSTDTSHSFLDLYYYTVSICLIAWSFGCASLPLSSLQVGAIHSPRVENKRSKNIRFLLKTKLAITFSTFYALVIQRYGYQGDKIFERAVGRLAYSQYNVLFWIHFAFSVIDGLVACYSIRRISRLIEKLEKKKANSDSSSSSQSTYIPRSKKSSLNIFSMNRILFESNTCLVLWLCVIPNRRDFPSALFCAFTPLMAIAYAITSFVRTLYRKDYTSILLVTLVCCFTFFHGVFWVIYPTTSEYDYYLRADFVAMSFLTLSATTFLACYMFFSLEKRRISKALKIYEFCTAYNKN